MDTQNQLYGLQFGVHATPWNCGRFRADVIVKAGAFHNNATSFAFTNGTSIGDTQNELAFAGELGVTEAYEFTDCIALRLGYQMTVVDGVALATEQLTTHQTTGGVANTDTSGNVLYHGGLIGLEFRR